MTDRPRKPPRFSLIDAIALVVGYGLASLLVRAYWPDNQTPSFALTAAVTLAFTWLGLAMSGPVVLLIRRPATPEPGDDERPPPRTWAELAWMIIGFYWIGLTMLLVPSKLDNSRVLDSALLGVFPFLAAIGLRFLGPAQRWARPRPGESDPEWTHRAGVILVVTWPFAWVGLILLGQTI